jgi:hypothetical protein
VSVGPGGRLNATSAAIAACLGLAASTPALAQKAVQWPVEEGGNGHWYMIAVQPQTSWHAFRDIALAQGGELASLGNAAEHAFVRGLAFNTPSAFVGVYGPFVGGFQDTLESDFSEPGGGWRWSDGTPWAYTGWHPAGEPNNCLSTCSGACVAENVIQLYSASYGGYWNDISPAPAICGGGWIATASVFEWSADCDGNGIVDYGEILDGTLTDTNANGVPDCCDAGVSCDPCPGDLNASNTVDAEDLAYVLFAWGTDGGKTPEADIDRSGTVDANDLSVVLGSWGPCPN